MSNVCRSVCETLQTEQGKEACAQYCDALERGALHLEMIMSGTEDTWHVHDEVVPLYGWSDPSAAGTDGAYLCRQPGSFFVKKETEHDSHNCFGSLEKYGRFFDDQRNICTEGGADSPFPHRVYMNRFKCRKLSCKETCPNLYAPGSTHPYADSPEGKSCAPHRDDFPDTSYEFKDGDDVQARWKVLGKKHTHKDIFTGGHISCREMKCSKGRRSEKFCKDGKEPPDDIVPPCLLNGRRAAYVKGEYTIGKNTPDDHYQPNDRERWLSVHDQVCIKARSDKTVGERNKVDVSIAKRGKNELCGGTRRVRCAYRLSHLHPSNMKSMLNLKFYDDRRHLDDDDLGGTIDQKTDMMTVGDAIHEFHVSKKKELPLDSQYAMQVRNANKAIWYQCMLPWTKGCPEGRSLCTVYKSEEFGDFCKNHMMLAPPLKKDREFEQILQGEFCFFTNDPTCPIYTDWKIDAVDFDGHVHGQVVRVPKDKAVDQKSTRAYAATLIEMYNLHDCDEKTHDYSFTVLSTRRDRYDNVFLSTAGTCVPKGSKELEQLEDWSRFAQSVRREDESGELQFSIKTPAEKSRWNGYLVSPCTARGVPHPGASTCCAGTDRDKGERPEETTGRLLMVEDDPVADGQMHEALAVKCVSDVFGESFDKIHSCETTENDLVQTIRRFMECENALRRV